MSGALLSAKDGGDRGVWTFTRLLQGLEDRGVLECEPDPQPEADQNGRCQEGDPPTPALELGLGHRHGQHRQHAVGHQVACRRTDLRGRRPEPALAWVAVLAGQQDGAAPLAADRDALREPHGDEDDRRDDSDRRMARDQADREGRDTDQQQRDDQKFLASDDVAEPAEHEPADGSRDIADGVRREREKGSGERILRRGRRPAGRPAPRTPSRSRSRTTRGRCR